MRQRPGLRSPIPHLESFPPHIRASAGAGFGTGLYAAPFRQRPGIRRYKARPSHTQRFLRPHPGSLAPMRQRPGLVSHSTSGKFPAPHPGSLGVPPIRGSGWLPQPKPEPHRRQRPALRPHQGPPAKSPEALPPPKASFAGESVFLQGAAQTGGKGRAARFRGYFQGVPQTRGKTHAERWIRSRSVPPGRRQRFRTVNNNSIRRAYPSEARQRFRTISKDGIRLGVPHGKAAKATAFCRHFPRLAGVPRQAAEARSCRTGHAAQRIPLRCAAKAAISAGHPPVIPPRHAAQVAHVLT